MESNRAALLMGDADEGDEDDEGEGDDEDDESASRRSQSLLCVSPTTPIHPLPSSSTVPPLLPASLTSTPISSAEDDGDGDGDGNVTATNQRIPKSLYKELVKSLESLYRHSSIVTLSYLLNILLHIAPRHDDNDDREASTSTSTSTSTSALTSRTLVTSESDSTSTSTYTSCPFSTNISMIETVDATKDESVALKDSRTHRLLLCQELLNIMFCLHGNVPLSQKCKDLVTISRVKNHATQCFDLLDLLPRSYSNLINIFGLQLDSCQRSRKVQLALKGHNYPLAVQLAMVFNMYEEIDEFDPGYDLLYPMLRLTFTSQKKSIHLYSWILEYVRTCPEEPRKKIVNLIAEWLSDVDLKKARQLIQKFGYSLNDFPCCRYRTVKQQVSWYVTIGKVEDFVYALCGQETPLQLMTLQLLRRHWNASNAALFDKLVFHWDLRHHPDVLSETITKQTIRKQPAVSQDSAMNSLTVPMSMIVFFDASLDPCKETAQALRAMEEDLRQATAIGVDVERIPSTFVLLDRASRTSVLLQLATHNRLYVIDLDMLESTSYGLFLQSCIESVLTSQHAIKIGVAFAEDWRILRHEFNTSSSCFKHVQRYVDLLPLLAPIKHVQYPAAVAQFWNKQEGGLSKLTRYYTGKILNKDEQLSNFSLRPLRQSQVLYAALDAYAAVLIYDRCDKSLLSEADLRA